MTFDQKTFEQLCSDLFDKGYILKSNICPDSNQTLYYNLFKDDCRVRREITYSIGPVPTVDNTFGLLKKHFGDMINELDECISSGKNVFYKRVLIEKIK